MGDAGELRFLVKHSLEQATRFAESAENGNIDDLPMCAFWLNAAYGFLKKLAKTGGTMTNSLKYENPKIILENPDLYSFEQKMEAQDELFNSYYRRRR
ncbi:MAG: hypothetical protein II957_04970 [Treponema sp.]|nr:hypothetical protein [Treponema sp.]